MEPVSKIDKRGDLNKQGGRKIFLKSINGEALIRVLRMENFLRINKRACLFIRNLRVDTYIFLFQEILFHQLTTQNKMARTNCMETKRKISKM